ncbi:delta-1-pyrroline-5-carboxylate dehydrogenase [Multifurca ochricompacta]|uniref:Delta-1-pyrroline-5-carboxylate dehydrogenase n=1 Tax=Multifurca ochricompacta TaxID=376703 RepID=A0AAD4MB38_9AGAM|nr:delta-1-pyrroline-5-carboxylate dehydrogenase [Multifurca ochricompacta]
MSAQLAAFKVPVVENEPLAAIKQMEQELPFEVPIIINGVPIKTGKLAKQLIPSDHTRHICTYHEADEATVSRAIEGALAAKADWEAMPWGDRAAIFLKAADLISKKYRYKLIAATILGQGKNAWQAEIDAAAELSDFFRFGVKYVEELYSQQPPRNSGGTWKCPLEYRPLEGFVLAVSPFNFTAIGGNLPGTPALVGNVVVWKPSPAATYSNYIVHQILTEAGVPPGVIQFVPGPPPEVVAQAIAHREFAALHFTGSTFVFKKLWKDIALNIDNYRSYPRIVGETGGKNFHLVHKSAEIRNAVLQSGGFKDQFLKEIAKIRVGPPQDFGNFIGPVIGRPAFEKITGYIQKAKEAGGEILIGGNADDSKGYFVQPTVILTRDPQSISMREEIFGPVVTAYVYEDDDFDKTLDLIDTTSGYALTGAIFASERQALIQATNKLRHAAGNQPFGGGRASGTNDKAGSIAIFYRFISARSIKENFVELEEFDYPSNLV